ncbi:MAG: LysR family transcriptional regulator [Hyphomicrobiaceae bacterium]|nr:LysR family transcriptional regulator [Hyphomicrobiaceae bacterium]
MQKSRHGVDWDLLRIFLQVARAGQFLAASRRLGLDQATVTRRIRALEAALGVRLFDRRPAGSALTAAGQRLIAHAERIEAEVLGLSSAFAQEGARIDGAVRVGAPDGFGTLFLAARLVPLVERHPALEVQLVPVPRSFSLSRREADIAITVERPAEGRLRVQKLTDYALSLYASRGYLDQAPALRSRQDLARHRHVTYVSDLLFAPSLDFRQDLGLGDAPEFQCASVLGQIEAVRSGMGIGLLHDYAVARVDGAVRSGIVNVLPKIRFTRSYWIVTHADIAQSAAVRAVHDYIVAITREARISFIGRRDAAG